MRTPPPLRVEIRRSRIATGLLLALLVSACSLVLLAQLDPVYRTALICGFFCCAVWQWRAQALPPWTHRPRVAALAWSAEQGWRLLLTGETEWRQASLLPGGVVHPWCYGLQFRTVSGQRHDLLLFADSSDAESLRRLRVLWRHGLDARKSRYSL